MKKKYSIGFIGCGNMSTAIINALNGKIGKSLLKSQGYKFNLAVSDIDEKKLECMSDNIATTTDNKQLLYNCDVIVLAVKPQNAQSVCEELDFSNKLVISIMAGVTFDRLKQLTQNSTPKIVRVMPNLNARIACAYSTYYMEGLDSEEQNLIGIILSTFGDCQKVPKEDDLNTTTGLCGSGPAYVFMFIQAFINSAIKHGFTYDEAKKMAIGTIIGSVQLIDSENKPIDELVESVCSKGGTTIEGVNYLKEMNFNDIVCESIEKAIIRAKELAK